MFTSVGTADLPVVEERSRRTWVLVITSIASLMVILDALVVATAMTAIRTDLGASITELEWTVNAYGLSFAVLLMTAAAAGDRWGRRRVFAAGVTVFAVASLVCAVAPNVETLVAGRMVQGAGAAFIMPLALALLSAAFPPELRPRALGVFASVSGVAVPLGPLVGGAVVAGVSWPWIFWINVPLGAVLLYLALTRIEESRGPDRAIDVPGLVLAGVGTFGLMWALIQGNTAGWAAAEVVGSAVAGLVAIGMFVGWQRRAAHPMLPLHLFRSRRFAAANVVIFFHWSSAFGVLFFMAQFLQTGLGYGRWPRGWRWRRWGLTTVLVPQWGGTVDRPVRRAAVHRRGARPAQPFHGVDRPRRRPLGRLPGARGTAGAVRNGHRDVPARRAERRADLGGAAVPRQGLRRLHLHAAARRGVRRGGSGRRVHRGRELRVE
ncbi:MFS transporter [Lentzea indica]|uniref:MFS transporter n=1 Tax=Lentzea indica TaxID=2604800 RepID=UPI0028B25D99|nr:MFS transporter [Lentzea indica]